MAGETNLPDRTAGKAGVSDSGSRQPAGWQLVFADEFDGFGPLDTVSETRNWRFETMQDPLHRAGNTGMDAQGNTRVPAWQSARGKRWSAWYDGDNDETAFMQGGNLVMSGHLSNVPDPTRPHSYYDEDQLTHYGNAKLYTSWIDTFSRRWDQSLNRHVMDPASPGKTFRYGYFEMRVNFSEMTTPGFRTSFWLMPASSDVAGQDLLVSHAYDADGDNGVEIDVFEYEYVSPAMQDKLVLALLGGAAGSATAVFDAATVGIALHEGYHTIGLLWEAHRLVWTLDGIVMKEVIDAALIPDVYSYLIVSREMNSGVKRTGLDVIEAGDVLEAPPYRPRDPGLYAKNVWAHRDRLATDRVLIDHVRVWQP